MRRVFIWSLAICVTLAMCSPAFAFANTTGESASDSAFNSDEVSLSAEELLEGADYDEGELIVIFDESESKRDINKTVKSNDGSVEEIMALQETKVALVTVDDNNSLKTAIEEFQSESNVLYVQPNYRYSVTEMEVTDYDSAETESTDTESIDSKSGEFVAEEADTTDYYLDKNKAGANYQYQLDEVNAFEAWDELTDVTDPVTVAVLDSGVDPEHEDLQENLDSSITSSGTYNAFVLGDEYTDMDSDVDTEDGHGTHCSGVIGATYNNSVGGAGVAAGKDNNLVNVLPVGVMDSDGYIYSYDCAMGLKYAVNQGAKVVSMSFGSATEDLYLKNIIRRYYEEGIVFVAASGNSGSYDYNSPGYFEEVIGVNASDDASRAAYYSNGGIETDITAPGTAILSTVPGDQYVSLTGTSMATPVVAAVCALVLDANPNLTPKQVYNIICSTATGNGSFNVDSAYGIVDAEAAVKAAKNITTNATTITPKTEEMISIDAGKTAGLEYIVSPSNWAGEVSWTSSDTGIVSVDKYGTIKGIKAGTAIVTATTSGKSAKWNITVNETTQVEKLELTDIEDGWVLPVYAGVNLKKYVSISPSNATDTKLYAEVIEGEDVAFVGDDLILQTKEIGEAKVRVYTKEGIADEGDSNYSKTFNITVKYPVYRIALLPTTNSIIKGNEISFKPKFDSNDEEIANPDHIVWSVGNKKIASIDQNGNFKALAAGKTYVKCKYTDDIVQSNEMEVLGKRQIAIWDKSYSTAATYNFKANTKTKKTVTLTWSKVNGADGYKIYKASSKNGTYKLVKTISNGSTLTYKYKTTKKAYYKIRAYMTMDNNSNVYSSNLNKMTGIYAKPKK